jgi:large subunit ribosomal protein L13
MPSTLDKLANHQYPFGLPFFERGLTCLRPASSTHPAPAHYAEAALDGRFTEAERDFSMGSFVPTAGSVQRQWYIIDAEEMVLGRVATEAARLLQGKHKPVYTPHIDTGDHVIVVNAARVRLTGRKEEQKLYRYHSGYEGGLREERAKDVRQKNPVRLVEEAVRGMLPKTKLGEAMWRKLKVYSGGDHPHSAQKPQAVKTTKREVA